MFRCRLSAFHAELHNPINGLLELVKVVGSKGAGNIDNPNSAERQAAFLGCGCTSDEVRALRVRQNEVVRDKGVTLSNELQSQATLACTGPATDEHATFVYPHQGGMQAGFLHRKCLPADVLVGDQGVKFFGGGTGAQSINQFAVVANISDAGKNLQMLGGGLFGND